MFILLLLLFFCRLYVFGEKNNEAEVDPTSKNKAYVYKSRCTRRYTPGTCADAVSSVWTYQFNKQNCTERLGCPEAYRANRFRSYGLCMRRCRPLVELYMQIMSYEVPKEENTNYLDTREQLQDIGARREGVSTIDQDLNSTQKETQEDEANDGKQYISLTSEDETISIMNYGVYEDTAERENFFPPDIDYVVSGGVDENDLFYEG